MAMPMTPTIHEESNARIIAAIAKGQTPPWRRRISDHENDGFPTRPAALKPFVGIDVLLLNMAATEQGFHSKFWASEPEWAYLYSEVVGEATILADGTAVFNGDQLLSSLGSVACRSRRRRPVAVDYSAAEAVIKASGADIRHVLGTEAAYYFPPADYIIFPMMWQFEQGPGGREAYWDSLFHELAHFSEPRLGWNCSDNCVRELRSEIAAPFLTSQLGIPVLIEMQKLTNHRKHLAQWITAMRADPTLIVQVAADASAAVAYLLSLRSS